MLNFINKKFLGKTFADVCCGIGGGRLVLESLGAKCVYAFESDKYASVMYKENFGEEPKKDLIVSEVPEHNILLFKLRYEDLKVLEVDVDIKPNNMICKIVDVIDVRKPEVIVVETPNTSDGVIEYILRKSGYDVCSDTLNACDYGVPQSRKSLYCVAFRKDTVVKNFVFPLPLELTKHVEDILAPASDIPTEMCVDRPDTVMNGKVEEYSNRPIQIGHIAQNRQGERIYSIKGTAITLTANGGGKFSKTGGYLIDDKVRKLTPRECARLMGFPDEFKICESNNQAYKQFGNSVVVDVIQYILLSIAEAYDEYEGNIINENSTLKKEYLNPSDKIFQFLSKFKVVDLTYIIRLIVNELNACFNRVTIYKAIWHKRSSLIKI